MIFEQVVEEWEGGVAIVWRWSQHGGGRHHYKNGEVSPTTTQSVSSPAFNHTDFDQLQKHESKKENGGVFYKCETL